MSQSKKLLLSIILCISSTVACNFSHKLAQEGIKHLEKGEEITALTFFEKSLKQEPKQPLALYGKGKLLAQSIITSHVAQDMLKMSLNTLSKQDQKYAEDIYIILARLAGGSKAIKILTDALPLFPTKKVYLTLGGYYTELKEYKRAYMLYKEKALIQYDNDIDLQIAMINSLLSLKLYRKAYNILKNIPESKRTPPILMSLVEVTYKLRQKKEVLVYIDMILTSPNFNLDKVKKEYLINLQKAVQNNI